MTGSETTPEEARSYIAIFRKHTISGTDTVYTNAGQINLDSMTDEEALFVAKEFRRMEIEAAQQRKGGPNA